MDEARGYSHRQRGWIHYACYPIALLYLVMGTAIAEGGGKWVFTALGVYCVLGGLCFHWMDVLDDGEALLLRFGPLPLFRKRIPYSGIRHVKRDRFRFEHIRRRRHMSSKVRHYQISGWDCVRLTVEGDSLWVGSNDAAGLEAFLKPRISRN